MNNRDRFGELEWVAYGAESYPTDGVTIVENPEGLRVGAHFAKPAPVRARKPGLWARFVRWANQGTNSCGPDGRPFSYYNGFKPPF